jgi:hypothetical protein
MMAAMRKLGLSTAALLVAGVALAAPASAGPPDTASGSFLEITGASTVTRVADGNLFVSGSDTGVYSGGLSGTVSDVWTAVVHKDGSFETKGTETCPFCTIGSRTGSFSAQWVFRGAYLPDGTGPFTGTLVFKSGTGGLAGLHGSGKFAGDVVAGTETYSFSYLFAP